MLDHNWFVEVHSVDQSAFGLKVKSLLHEEQSAYQKIAIYETETFGRLMVIDGCVMLTDRDNFLYHEMMTHPAIFCHPSPRDILVIGGGDCGTLQEVLRHPEIRHVDQVEIDERVTRLSEQFFPDLCRANQDSRAHFHFKDGIRWVEESEEGRYDIIIVDSTDPVGPAEGLFNAPFYQSCYRILKKPGILIQQSESPLYHLDLIRNIHQIAQQTGFDQTEILLFPQCVYPSGWWSASMAGKGVNLKSFRLEASQQKPFPTRYYNAEVHQAALIKPEFLKTLSL